MPQSSLKEKAVNGVLWTSVERFGGQVLSLLIGIVIARILSPEDYGIVGMLAIFMAVSNTLLDSGFGSALIQNRNRTEADYSTCFYFNILVGLTLYVGLFLSAPFIAEFYRTPLLEPVCRGLGLVLVFNSLTIAQTARLTAELKFRELCIITLGTQLLTGVIGLVMAFIGYGVWVLVFQQVGTAFLRLCFIEWSTRWKPLPFFSKEAFHRMFSFGSKILCSGMINTLYDNLYTLVIGRVFSPAEVGFYNRGNQFAQLPSQTLLSVVMKVAYPLMSEVQHDSVKLCLAYRKFLRVSVFVLYPVLVGLMVLSEPFIHVLLGEKWLPCVPLMQILCLGYLFDPLTHINLNILYVKGRTDLVLKLEFIKKPIAFLILFGMIPFGLWWMCAGRVLYGVIAYCFNCYYTGKFIGFSFWQQMCYNVPVIVKSVLMGLVCWVTALCFEAPWTKLLLGILAGVISYVGMVFITRDESFYDLKEIIFKRK